MRYPYWFSSTFHVVFPRLSKHLWTQVCDLVLGVAGTKLSWGVAFFGWGLVEIFRLLNQRLGQELVCFQSYLGFGAVILNNLCQTSEVWGVVPPTHSIRTPRYDWKTKGTNGTLHQGHP